MNKYANTKIPLSPEDSYLASQLLGGSLFSAIQLNQEMQRIRDLEKRRDDQTLTIPLPMDKLKVAEDEGTPGIIGRALRFNRSPIRTFIGAERGFEGAKKDYYDAERAEIAKQLELAQKEYLHTLQRIKTGEETPCVDSFCSGMATELALGDVEKTAETDISDGSVRRVLGDILGIAKKPLQPAIDLGATGLLGTAAGSSYLTYLLKKQMRDSGRDQGFTGDPTRVQLVPM